MGKFLLIFLVVVVPIHVVGQDDMVAETEKFRAVIHKLALPSGKATILTRKLVTHTGNVVSVYKDSFNLKIRKKVYSTISYDDVLELWVGEQYVSVVPEATKPAHGMWEDVGRVYAGTRVVVVFPDGKSIKGFSNSASQTHLIMVDENGRERVDIPRDRVAAFYGLVGGYGGVREGASKGGEVLHTGGRDKIPGLVGSGVGALIGLVKSDGRPILIYSK